MSFVSLSQLDYHMEKSHGRQEPENSHGILKKPLQDRWNALTPKFLCDACNMKLESESAHADDVPKP